VKKYLPPGLAFFVRGFYLDAACTLIFNKNKNNQLWINLTMHQRVMKAENGSNTGKY
jgi:hypothetical protein